MNEHSTGEIIFVWAYFGGGFVFGLALLSFSAIRYYNYLVKTNIKNPELWIGLLVIFFFLGLWIVLAFYWFARGTWWMVSRVKARVAV
jgi:hypothetical protein